MPWPTCSHEFTIKTAAQGHVQKQSCGRPRKNHGHALALDGRRSLAAAPAQAPAVEAAPQAVQARLEAYLRHMPGLDLLPGTTSPQASWPPKRPRHQAAAQPNLEQKLAELSMQLQQVCQLVVSRDQSLRELEACSTRSFVFDRQAELATGLSEHIQPPSRGQAHPQGPARHTVAAALANCSFKKRTEAKPCQSSQRRITKRPRLTF